MSALKRPSSQTATYPSIVLAERITRLDRAVDVLRELRAILALCIALAVAIGDLDVVIGTNSEVTVEVPRCPRDRVVIGATRDGLETDLGAAMRPAPLDRGIVERDPAVGGVPHHGVRRDERGHEGPLRVGGPNASIAAAPAYRQRTPVPERRCSRP